MKKRITGAIVLVALVVIFVPMLLEDDAPEIELGPLIPEQPNDQFEQQLIPSQDVTEPSRADQTAMPRYELPVGEVLEQAETAPPAPASIQPVEPVTEVPVSTPDPAPVAQPSSPPPPSGTVNGQGWVVQAGSFGQRENADKLVARLKASGRETFIEPIDVKGKTLHRVRVGPFADRAVADQELSAIESGFQIKGKVLAFP